ncbi:restriction endonuclease subunit S [uncultured Limosilactobacillus sp.]|uniref:restriction endonuclease subunit S n=1 Tax=uncultured Limosilactobacillus sp. TaxID=2837629 RepID=UPI0025E0F7B8|nr:restriction endonuclease subunit S [uncultured Limosilactobacillus sp.]
MKVKLKDLVIISNDREQVENVNLNNYVSTENLLANRNGVKFPANNMPSAKTVSTYKKGDILVSNIRPYFKKIWKAKFNGPKSNDVIAFRTNSPRLMQDYLYVLLQSDNFFDYVTSTAKGTKMPRGDKNAIRNYTFELPNLNIQKKIANTILVIEEKVKLNNQINDNLAA